MDSTALASIIASPLAALGGFYLSGVNEARRDARASEREDAAREEEWEVRKRERITQFNLEVLLPLQDALQQFAISISQVIFFDRHKLRERGRRTLLPDDLNERAHERLIEVRRLKERVLDTGIRDDIERLIQLAFAEIIPSGDESIPVEQAINALVRAEAKFSEHYDRVNSRVGELIRSEYR